MSKFSVIVFDLGNVLIPFDYNQVIQKFNNVKEGLGDKFKDLYAKNYFIHQKFEKGELTFDEFVDIMLNWLEGLVTKDLFVQTFANIFTINQNVVDLIPVLKEKYFVALLSNTNILHKEYGYGHFGFLKLFDKTFYSHEIGAIKPEEKIYRTVELFTQKPSAEHFFIDDVLEYVEGAKKCGWNGVQFIDYEKLIDDLKSYEIL
ncbi:MAG: HAD family phosphatase [Melioribacteraceae bacterium]|nr:HAD family phosphatase [Melioribacteraceae bacterium]